MSVVSYPCPNCGGDLAFKAETQNFVCEWCMSEFTKEDLEKTYGDQTAAAEETVSDIKDFSEGTNLYVCGSCGAEIIADENTAATFCYYCHNPVALSGRLSGSFCPEKIIPFKKSKEQALGGFREWCGKKWFLPSGFTSEAQLEKITGLYVPFWLADCHVRSELKAKGKIVNVTHMGDTTITHTKVFDVRRSADMDYNGVPADGSLRLDDSLMDSIEPFDYEALTDFSMTYLQGFYADKYDVDKHEVIPRIKSRIETAAKKTVLDDVTGYTSVDSINFSANILNTKWRYMLLPVWFLSYDYRGKKYFYAMNGQTGKFSGIMPVSIPKLIVAMIAFAAAAFVAGFLIGGIFLV